MRRSRLGCTSNVSLNSQRVCRVAFHGASGVGGAWVKLCPFGNRVAVPGLCMYARSLPDGKSSTNDVGSRHMDMDGGDEEENDGFSLADFKLSPENKVILACAFSFVIAQMDKINISIAVIEMAKDFGWSPTVIGLVQSSFFYGYLLSQLPGGYASTKFGGRNVLYFAVISFSLSTMCIPFAASTIPGLFLSRAAVGFGEGLLPAAVTDLIARTVQPSQRSGATSFVFGALQVGSLVGLTLAPHLLMFGDGPQYFICLAVGVCYFLFGGTKFSQKSKRQLRVYLLLWWTRVSFQRTWRMTKFHGEHLRGRNLSKPFVSSISCTIGSIIQC
eukprot:jgi/Picre1/30930/NNA_006289.t1